MPIIDSKSPAGKRISVSIGGYLYAIYCSKNGVKSRSYIIAAIKSGAISNSKDATKYILDDVVDKRILAKFQGPEYQTDIEDF